MESLELELEKTKIELDMERELDSDNYGNLKERAIKFNEKASKQ